MAEWTGRKRTLNSIEPVGTPPVDAASGNEPPTPPAPGAEHSPQRPGETPDAPDSADMEEGLSRLKLAIKALDDQFRSSPVFSHDLPLAEAG